MPSLFRRQPADRNADATPANPNTLRLAHIDRELAGLAAVTPRTDVVRKAIDHWLDRRNAHRGGAR